MQLTPGPLPGVWQVIRPPATDARGFLLKYYQHSGLQAAAPGLVWQEGYVTESAPGVLRGMHLQLPPYHHHKLVMCLSGTVQDVVLDVRPGAHYGQYAHFTLGQGMGLLLPPGLAHGFCVPPGQPPALLLYLVTTEYAPAQDGGIRHDSFGYDWHSHLKSGQPSWLVSERDQSLPTLVEFVSPFK